MRKIALLVLFSSLILASRAEAQINNGDFASGDLTGWQTLGAPTVVASGGANSSSLTGSNPTTLTGGNQAVISSTSGDVGPTLTISASVADIDAALGVTLPSTTGTPPASSSNPHPVAGTFVPFNGQAIYQTFTTGQSGTLSFDFAYVSEDYAPYDSAGFVLDGVYTQLVATPTYVDSEDALHDPVIQPQAYTSFSLNLAAGSHTLGFVSYNTNDHYASTDLYVSNIQPTALVDTPEPGTWALLVTGLGVLIVLRRLKKIA